MARTPEHIKALDAILEAKINIDRARLMLDRWLGDYDYHPDTAPCTRHYKEGNPKNDTDRARGRNTFEWIFEQVNARTSILIAFDYVANALKVLEEIDQT